MSLCLCVSVSVSVSVPVSVYVYVCICMCVRNCVYCAHTCRRVYAHELACFISRSVQYPCVKVRARFWAARASLRSCLALSRYLPRYPQSVLPSPPRAPIPCTKFSGLAKTSCDNVSTCESVPPSCRVIPLCRVVFRIILCFDKTRKEGL